MSFRSCARELLGHGSQRQNDYDHAENNRQNGSVNSNYGGSTELAADGSDKHWG